MDYYQMTAPCGLDCFNCGAFWLRIITNLL